MLRDKALWVTGLISEVNTYSILTVGMRGTGQRISQGATEVKDLEMEAWCNCGVQRRHSLLRAKDLKVRRARICETVAGLVLQGTQVTNADPWMRDKEVLHACRQLVRIMKDVEGSLDDVRDDFEGMRVKTEIAVEATTLGIKPSQA